MSKKNLLNESTIRKFMKLASIEPLASDFISKIQEAEEDVEEGMRMKKDDDESMREADEDLDEGRPGKEEVDEGKHEDEVDEGMRFKADDDDVDEGMRMKADDDDKMEEDVDLEERGMMFKDDDDMGGGDKMLNMNDFLDILEKAVEEFLGEPTDIERDEEPADDMEMDMEEPADDMEMDMKLDMDADEEEPEMAEGKDEDLAEAIYKEVLKRISNKK